MGAAKHTGLHQSFGVDSRIGVKLTGINGALHTIEIHFIEPERELHVLETAFRQTAMHGHLAALEPFDAHAGTCGLALAAATPGLAFSRADTPADARPVAVRARIIGDFSKFHRSILCSSCHPASQDHTPEKLLLLHHPHEVADLVD